MMASLFSNFDPCCPSFVFSNWVSIFLILLFTPYYYWYTNNRHTYLSFNLIFKPLHNEFKLLINEKVMNGATLLFLSLLSFIAANNFLGLFPYIFTASSHLVMALSLALPLWLTYMLYGWINNMKHMFTHLVPLNTPGVLMPFMVLIETISNIIRPGTLTVRLSANMIAGHLLLTLLGNQSTSSLSHFILTLLLFTQVALLLLESAVALIQAYVFTVLTTLYSSEIN